MGTVYRLMIISCVIVRQNNILVLYIICCATAALPVCDISLDFSMGTLAASQNEEWMCMFQNKSYKIGF